MNIFYRLTLNTFKECVREPVFFLLLLVGLVLICVLPMFSMFVFREQVKLVVDSSMAATMVLGLIVAALCSSHTITREMRNGTVLLLLSKPVPRYSFIVAKIAGVTMALTIFTFAMISASFVAVMIAKDQFRLDFGAMAFYYGLLAVCALLAAVLNYIKNMSFTSTITFLLAMALPVYAVLLYFVRGAPDDEGFVPPLQFVTALSLLFPAIWLMGAISAALATRCGIVTNLTTCSVLFFLGLVSKYVSTRWLGGGVLGDLLSAVLPNWQYFWMADALAAHTQIPLRYLGWALLYSIIYGGFWSVWAMALFNDREVAKDAIN